jgi:hypothetical protein
MTPERKIQYYLVGLGLAGLACLIWLVLIPSDAKGALLFGFSAFRLFLFGILLIPILTSFFLAFKGVHSSQWKYWWGNTLNREKVFILLKCASLIGLLLSLFFLLLFPLYKNGVFLPYYQRLQPLAVWLLSFCIISPLFITFYSPQEILAPVSHSSKTYKLTLLIFILLLAIWLVILATGLGTTPDPSYWDDHHPVPLLEGQLMFVCLGGLLAVFINFLFQWICSRKTKKFDHQRLFIWLDVALFVIIWFSAFSLWIQQPIPNSYFTPRIRPPNYEVYPYSDARVHDSDSQGILLGEVNSSQRIIRRPVYALFLAGLHSLGGQDYTTIILLQVLVMAFVPALMYLLVKRMGNRLVGILLAFFTILIEFNTLQVASLTTTSNTKILMTEWPAMLLMVGLVLLLVTWAGKPENRKLYPLIIGGVLGALILLRSQSLILIPFILVVLFFILHKKWKTFLSASFLFGLGIGLLIIPWLFRNWQIIGKISFEDPRYARAVIQRFENQANVSGISQQEEIDISDSDLFGSAIQYMLKNPVEYSGFVVNNFIHNEVLSVFIFPVRSLSVIGLAGIFKPVDLFWLDPANVVQIPQVILLIIYLAIISLGIAFAFNHWNIIGLIPLIIHFAYNLSSAASRISGWRFILPVQWIVVFYFCVGLAQLFIWLLVFFGFSFEKLQSLFILGGNPEQVDKKIRKSILRGFLICFFTLDLIGLALPGAMQLVYPRYASQDKATLSEELLADKNWVSVPQMKEEVIDLLMDDQIIVEKGMAFYPRFYAANEGEPGLNAGTYQFRLFPRFIFLLISKDQREIMLPTQNSPQYFPNAVEVIVVGRQNGDDFETLLVNVVGKTSFLYFSDLVMLQS